MQEVCREQNIGLRESPDGSVTLKADPGRSSQRPTPDLSERGASVASEKVEKSPIETNSGGEIFRKVPGNAAGQTAARPGQCDSPCKTQDKNSDLAKSGRIRRDFSLLTDFVYLDNATMSLSPEPVLEAMLEYERKYRAGAMTGSHRLAGIAYQRYWHAHEKVEKFIGGSPGQGGVTVFTHSLTEAMEIVRNGTGFRPGDMVLTGPAEPGSSVLPWRYPVWDDLSLCALPIRSDYNPDLERLGELTGRGNVRLFFISHVSDLFGSVAPLEEIISICHENGTMVLVDGSHSVSHMPVDVTRLGMDYFCFSGHTMLGPTGTGVLWIRDTGTLPAAHGQGSGILQAPEPAGGKGAGYFEMGTPNIAGSVGLGAAVDYLTGIGMDWIRDHDHRLTERLITGLSAIDGITLYSAPESGRRIGNVCFSLRGIGPGDMARYLEDEADVLTGSAGGELDARMESLGLPGYAVQVGIGLYNNEQDIDTLLAAVAGISRGL